MPKGLASAAVAAFDCWVLHLPDCFHHRVPHGASARAFARRMLLFSREHTLWLLWWCNASRVRSARFDTDQRRGHSA